jgi:ribosome maturation factor RimP
LSKSKGGSSKKSTADLVAELAQPLADELGLFLWDVRFEKEGATWYLRVLIDKDGGGTMEDCENFTRPFNKILDEADPIPQSYVF